MHRSNHRVLCTIAGFDPTGGAGTTIDLAVFEAFGATGRAVVTVQTEQDEGGVRRLGARDPAVVGAELARILAEDEPAALKLGALGTLEIVEAVAAALADTPPRPVVFDPVLEASSGGALLEPAARAHVVRLLGPHVTLLTPNLVEAEILAGGPGSQEELALALCKQGWATVLVKGGHAEGEDRILDVGYEGPSPEDLMFTAEQPRLPPPAMRGTGCALSAAIAARLAAGMPLGEAMGEASFDLGDWWDAAREAGRSILPPLAPVALPSREAQE